MAQETVILKARQQRTERIAGRFFTVISATAKFTVELDGRIRREVRSGSRINGQEFKQISFIETAGVENTVVFDAGFEEYTGEVQVSTSPQNTFLVGNMDIADGAAAVALISPACDANGYLQIVSTDSFRVVGTRSGYRRKLITFFVKAGTNDLNISTDSGGTKTFAIVAKGTEKTIETDADFWIIGISGTSHVVISEIYLTQ